MKTPLSPGTKKTVGFVEEIIDVTIDTDEQRTLGMQNKGEHPSYDGPIVRIYEDKHGMGGDGKKLAFEHKAKESWV